MLPPIANLLEFLETVFSAEMDLWNTSSTDEDAVRSIARGYPRAHQQALLSDLDLLLASAPSDAFLLETAQRAQVNFVLDESNVREWITMIRDQVRVVLAAG